MAGSFSVANPAQAASHRTAAWVYLGLIGLSIVVALAAVAYLIRGRHRSGVTTGRGTTR